MPITKVLLQVFLALALLKSRATATEAIRASANSFIPIAFSTNACGFAFSPLTNIWITALGNQFPSAFPTSEYTYSAAMVRLLDAEGDILTGAIVTTNAPKVNDYFYEAITPVPVAAGETNYILGFDYGTFTNGGQVVYDGGLVDTGSCVIAEEIDYLGAAIGVHFDAITKDFLFQGANFQFITQPTPTKLELIQTTPNSILLMWPEAAADYTLKTAPDLESAMTNVTQIPSVIGGVRVLSLPIDSASRFFRLVNE